MRIERKKNDFKLLYNTGFTCSNSKRDERILKWFAVNVRLYYVHWNKRRAQAFVCWFAFVRAEKIRYTTYSLSFPPLYSKYIEYSESPHRLFLNERTLRFDILTVSAMNAKEKQNFVRKKKQYKITNFEKKIKPKENFYIYQN